jgi:hypothetical protein
MFHKIALLSLLLLLGMGLMGLYILNWFKLHDYPVCGIGQLADIEDGDLILFLHGDFLRNRVKRIVHCCLLTHPHFSHVGVAWRDPTTNTLYVLEVTDDVPTSINNLTDRVMPYDGRIFCMKRKYPAKVLLTKDEVLNMAQKFRFWLPPHGNWMNSIALSRVWFLRSVYALQLNHLSQRHEIYCTEWVSLVQSMFNGTPLKEARLTVGMRKLLQLFGSNRLFAIRHTQADCVGT